MRVLRLSAARWAGLIGLAALGMLVGQAWGQGKLAAPVYPGAKAQGICGGATEADRGGEGSELYADVPTVKAQCFVTTDPIRKVKAFYDGKLGPLSSRIVSKVTNGDDFQGDEDAAQIRFFTAVELLQGKKGWDFTMLQVVTTSKAGQSDEQYKIKAPPGSTLIRIPEAATGGSKGATVVREREQVLAKWNDRALAKWKAMQANGGKPLPPAAASKLVAEVYPGATPQVTEGGKAVPCIRSYRHDPDVPFKVWCYLTNDPIEKVKAFYDEKVGPMDSRTRDAVSISMDPRSFTASSLKRTQFVVPVERIKSPEHRDWVSVWVETAAETTNGTFEKDFHGGDILDAMYGALKYRAFVEKQDPKHYENAPPAHTQAEFEQIVAKYGWINGAYFTRQGRTAESTDRIQFLAATDRGMKRTMQDMPKGLSKTAENKEFMKRDDYAKWGTYVDLMAQLEKVGYRTLIMIGESLPEGSPDLEITRDRAAVADLWKGAPKAAPAAKAAPTPEKKPDSAPATAKQASPAKAPATPSVPEKKDGGVTKDDALKAGQEGFKLIKKLF